MNAIRRMPSGVWTLTVLTVCRLSADTAESDSPTVYRQLDTERVCDSTDRWLFVRAGCAFVALWLLQLRDGTCRQPDRSGLIVILAALLAQSCMSANASVSPYRAYSGCCKDSIRQIETDGQ